MTKEIPLSLIWSMLLVAIGLISSYVSLKADVADQGKDIAVLTTALKETNSELRALTKEFAAGAGPSAQNTLRLQMVEGQLVELKARMADMERSAMVRESRLQRMEAAMQSTNARMRAQIER